MPIIGEEGSKKWINPMRNLSGSGTTKIVIFPLLVWEYPRTQWADTVPGEGTELRTSGLDSTGIHGVAMIDFERRRRDQSGSLS
jgi:hypothetical protein